MPAPKYICVVERGGRSGIGAGVIGHWDGHIAFIGYIKVGSSEPLNITAVQCTAYIHTHTYIYIQSYVHCTHIVHIYV